MWHLSCAQDVSEGGGVCAWGEGQGLLSVLWNIRFSRLDRAVALGKDLSLWQPTGCRVTPPRHFPTLLGRSQQLVPGWSWEGQRCEEGGSLGHEPESLASRVWAWESSLSRGTHRAGPKRSLASDRVLLPLPP